MLIVIAGLPGSGKSTLATALGQRLGVPVLSVDTIENAMLQAGLTPGWDVGAPAAYEVAGAVAAQHLTAGRSVIVDAVSDSEAARETWRVAAARGQAELKVIEVRCGDELEHRRRLSERRRGLAWIAEPTWADVERRAAAAAPWREERLIVDTARDTRDNAVEQVLAYLQADDVQLNYPEVGATSGTLPAGYALVRRTAELGHGRPVFDTAAERLMSWDMHRRAGLRVEAAAGRAVVGGDVRVVLSLGPLSVVAPCRVVRVVDEPRARGFAYGTLTGHPEMGEESFVVRLDDQDRVTLEIVAFSRPARWWSRLGAPVSRLVQRRVTGRYLAALASG